MTGIGAVVSHDHQLVRAGLELVLKGLELAGVAAGHEHLAAGIAVCLGEHAAQRAGGACDESDLALDGEHIVYKAFFYGYHVQFLLIMHPDS